MFVCLGTVATLTGHFFMKEFIYVKVVVMNVELRSMVIEWHQRIFLTKGFLENSTYSVLLPARLKGGKSPDVTDDILHV